MINIILKLDIKDSRLQLLLKNERVTVDQLELPVNRNLDQQLIAGLDKLFKRNKLNNKLLKKVEISSNIDKKSSYWKVMTAFKKGLLSY